MVRTSPQTDNLTQSVMGWGNRGWIEIIEIMLEICKDGALKTHVMYQCGLNSKQLGQYLQFLQNHNLVESKLDPLSNRPIFKTTEIGIKYIAVYKEIEKMFR